MARIHGRNARLYAGIASGGTAEPVAYINSFSLQASTDKQSVTAFGDTSMVYVAGLPDSSGSFSGFWDNATAQTWTAATDGVARKWYFYPDTTAASTYWFGTGFFDFNIDVKVDGAAEIKGNFSAATPTAKVPSS